MSDWRSTVDRSLWVFMAILAIFLIGLAIFLKSQMDGPRRSPVPPPPRTASPTAVAPKASPPRSAEGRFVEERQFGSRWPLTVSSGYVGCVPLDRAVFRTGGKTYALNGLAKTAGYQKIDPIWKANPNPALGPKVNLGPLIDLALAECE